MSKAMGDVWVVAGAPGSGKSTVAALLLSQLDTTPALLDKDVMYGSFVSSILLAAGRPQGEREGDWYDEHIKAHEYQGIIATTREIRSYGCPVLLCAPFTRQIHDVDTWHEWAAQLGGEHIHLVWVQTDEDTLRQRLERRNSERDSEKLANFRKFINYMQIDSPPPVLHIAVDNRQSASDTLEKQVTDILRDSAKHPREPAGSQ